MALVLALVFRSRLRLLPLLVALAAVAITFGAMSLLGAPLTMASIAVLPVLLGLGVDYAIQYQARVEEEGGDAGRAAARWPAPTIATAALATGVGFLVLLLSPVPMVRGFGALLVVGIVFALLLALTAGTAALGAVGCGASATARWRARCAAPASWPTPPAPALARRRGPGRRRRGDAVLRGALRRPGRVLRDRARAGGGRLGGRLPDGGRLRRRAARAAGPARRCATSQALQRATGVAGEIDVVVEGDDLTDPKVVAWMRDYQAGLLKKYGYSATNGCGKAELCPALSLHRPLPRRDGRGHQASRCAGCSTRCRRTSRRR